MLKEILKKSYLALNKVKIIHSIPGRIRLFIPLLNKVPEELKKYENYVSSILKLKTGINKIDYSYTTSKILIEYDKNKLNEKDIVNWMNKIWLIILDNRNLYKNISFSEIENNMDKFYKMLKNKLVK